MLAGDLIPENQSVTSKLTDKGEGSGRGRVAGAGWHRRRRQRPGGCSPTAAPCSASPRVRERPSAPSPSWLLGTAACHCWAGEKTLSPPLVHQPPLPNPHLFWGSPPLSAAEQQPGPCIIYLLGNVDWDLLFNNCRSNISFPNPLRSVAVAVLNIYQSGLCVHC